MQFYYDKHFVMNILKLTKLLLLLLLAEAGVYGQDPSFSQFFASPLNVNPALTGAINGKWRIISNFRDEWVTPATPYVTTTISYDTKILRNKIPENSVFGMGVMIMHDEAMSGILKSNYASLDLSYNIKIIDGEVGSHRLGMGVGLIYGSKKIDFNRLYFEHQFAGYGFNTSLPTGESALSNMQSYFSASAGLLYSYVSQYSNFDFGVSAFHLNEPRQTVVNDPNQYLAPRYVIHTNYDNHLNEKVVLNTNAIFQTQAKASYFSVGGSLGYFLSEEGEPDLILNGGLWYWSQNAIIPYVGLVYKNYQFGFSYDVTISKLASAQQKPRSFELSIIIRGDDKPSGIIWCPSPWK